MSKISIDELDAFMNETIENTNTNETSSTETPTKTSVEESSNIANSETKDEINKKINGFCYDENGNRYILGVPFPEIRKKFDGEDKDYIIELTNTFMALLEKLVEKSKNKD